jgi:multidrug resistance efflux pump
VAVGQVVARLDCRDLEADLAAAEARLQEMTAVRQRLLRGGRADARAEAEAQIHSAEARFSNARLAHERASRLFSDDQIIPRSAVDAAERDERVAASDLEAARQHAALIRAEPLAEERAAADATVASAHWLSILVLARLTSA